MIPLRAAPTLSLLIPTFGRDSLRRTIASALPQLAPGDEIVVIGDTRLGPLPGTAAICAAAGSRVRYLPHDGGRMSYGHDQLNHGMRHATGDYLAFNDDDDIWTPGALDALRRTAATHPGVPLLFRFRSYHGGRVFWDTAGLIAEGHIGGHCLVAPNDPAKLGKWTRRYQGDFDFVRDTLARYPRESALWLDVVIAIARPA